MDNEPNDKNDLREWNNTDQVREDGEEDNDNVVDLKEQGGSRLNTKKILNSTYGLNSGKSPRLDEVLDAETTLNFTYNISEEQSPLFEEVSSKAGLVTNLLENESSTSTHEGRHGVGVFVSDYNRDEREDVLALVRFTPVLFKNTPDGFVETEVIDTNRKVTSALFFDYNNDGYDDLYLLSDEESVFLENTGGGFETREVGLGIEYDSVRGASAADYTGNGCLDVFVIQAADWKEKRPEGYEDRKTTIDEDNGNENRLFAGNCETFKETTGEAGIEGKAWSLASSFVDFTNDGRPDIHVANDFNNDVMYFNNGDGTFERHVMPEFTNRNGMSSEVADINNDGYLDIFVSNIYYGASVAPNRSLGGRVKGNSLLKNKGNRSFTDVAEKYGVRRGGWGWAALFEDFNNDRDLELYQSTTDFVERPEMFWVQSNGEFELVHPESTGFGRKESSSAVSLDYNTDGQLDIIEAEGWMTNELYLYENQVSSGNRLTISVYDEGNTTIGTRVKVVSENGTQNKIKKSNTDYLSQGSRNLHFGLGETSDIHDVVVTWPDGTTEVYNEVRMNQSLLIHRREGLLSRR